MTFYRNTGKLDATSLKALKEMLPTSDERNGLLKFMNKEEGAKEQAYMELSECEKYMYSMLSVKDASAKFDCMLFRVQFNSRCDELLDSIKIVEKACDEVTTSERLQTVMAMILTLVNQINTGGDGNEAAGFTLDALLKLNEVRLCVPLLLSRKVGLTVIFFCCRPRQRPSTRKPACFTILLSL